MRWIDLSAHDLKLIIAQLPSQRRLLVLLGADKHPEASSRLGFSLHPQTNLWIKRGASFVPAEFKREFPGMKLIDNIDARKVLRLIGVKKAANPEVDGQEEMPLESSLDTLLSQSRFLGVNASGHRVFEGPEGRFIEQGERALLESELETRSDAVFLRATNDETLSSCAEGLIEQIASGAIIRGDDFVRFASAIYDESVDLSDVRAAIAFDAVSAAAVRWLSRNSDGSAYETYGSAVRLHEALPCISDLISRNEGVSFLSAPIQVAAARALGNTKDLGGQTVVVPNVKAGTFLGAIPASARLRAYAAPDSLESPANPRNRNVLDLPPDYEGADAILGHYRREILASPVPLDGENFHRSDLIEVFNSLEARKENGRSVYILEGASADEAEEFESFRHWLGRNYAIEGAIDVSGSVHSGLAQSPDMRIYVVGRRRPAPLEQVPEPALRLKKARDLHSLWSWTSEVIANRRKVAEFYDQGAEHEGDEAVADPSLLQNRYQTPYQAVSRIGQATTMVPRNLEGATREALDRVLKVHPDIDRYVAKELAMPVSQLGEAFSPEQIDALALAFYALDAGRAFLIGDDTGIGKGRTMASVMRRAILQGKRVLFLTEKAMNLSDIWRDVRHIGAEDDFAPFILNSGVKIIDEETGDVVLRSRATGDIRQVVEAGEWPAGVNLVLATYGQFNRSPDVSAKSRWLREIADENVLIVTDEAQNATSLSSNTAKNLSYAKDLCAGPFYGSATFAKNASSMAFFSRLFPNEMSGEKLIDIIRKGGETMQEIVSTMLARDGVFIRREHDLSNVTFTTNIDTANKDRNTRYTDILAEILAEIASMSGEFNQRIVVFNEQRLAEAEARNADLAPGQRRILPLQMQNQHFGSPLFNIARTFTAALNIDQTVEQAINALRNNQKPVVLVDATLETLLKDLVENEKLVDGRMPDFKDVLHRVVTQLTVTRRRRGNEAPVEVNLADQYPDLAVRVEHVRRMIDEMPDLGVSIIDIIRERIEREGYRCGEITGRKFHIVEGDVVRRDRTEKVVIKNQFNSGDLDALIINSSGATGIDLHAGRRFIDQRQRVMILLQTPGDIVKEMQAWGRVNRFDQVIGPIISTPQTGLPVELRLAANRNAKLRRMSANVTSNRDSASLIADVPDLINSIGDLVCSRFAAARPDIMRRIGLSDLVRENNEEDDDLVLGDDADDIRRGANTILSRLIMLNTAEQEQALDEITAEYYATLEELDANGVNPLRSREIEGKVYHVNRTVFEGADVDLEGRSAFDAPVYLDTVHIERFVNPVRFEELADKIETGVRLLGGETMQLYADRMLRRRSESLSYALPAGVNDVDAAVAMAGEGSVLAQRARRYDRFIEVLRMLEPGVEITFTMDDGETRKGIVTEIEAPKRGFDHISSMYRVKMYEPGESLPRIFFVDTLLSDENFSVSRGVLGEDYDAIATAFDCAPEGIVRREGLIMTGNLFRAMELNVGFKLGTLSTYENEHGVRDRALAVTKKMRTLDNIPVRLLNGKMVAAAMKQLVSTIRSESDLSNSGVIITTSKDSRILHLPSPRARKYAEIYTHPLIEALYLRGAGNLEGKRARAVKVAVSNDEIPFVADALFSKGVRFFIESRHREWANKWIKNNPDQMDLNQSTDTREIEPTPNLSAAE